MRSAPRGGAQAILEAEPQGRLVFLRQEARNSDTPERDLFFKKGDTVRAKRRASRCLCGARKRRASYLFQGASTAADAAREQFFLAADAALLHARQTPPGVFWAADAARSSCHGARLCGQPRSPCSACGLRVAPRPLRGCPADRV
jgi:hypothetical protein